jgi:hypothetical protein
MNNPLQLNLDTLYKKIDNNKIAHEINYIHKP